jgi:hypothetical protein
VSNRLPAYNDAIPEHRPVVIDWGLSFEDKLTIQACAYWQSCCHGRVMPERADLQFAAMTKFAANLVLLELRSQPNAPSEYCVRLAGANCEAVFGHVTGRSTAQIAPPNIEMRWRAVFDLVVVEKKPLRVSAGIEFERKTWLQTESFVAPLGDGDQIKMLLICFTAKSVARSEPTLN